MPMSNFSALPAMRYLFLCNDLLSFVKPRFSLIRCLERTWGAPTSTPTSSRIETITPRLSRGLEALGIISRSVAMCIFGLALANGSFLIKKPCL